MSLFEKLQSELSALRDALPEGACSREYEAVIKEVKVLSDEIIRSMKSLRKDVKKGKLELAMQAPVCAALEVDIKCLQQKTKQQISTLKQDLAAKEAELIDELEVKREELTNYYEARILALEDKKSQAELRLEALNDVSAVRISELETNLRDVTTQFQGLAAESVSDKRKIAGVQAVMAANLKVGLYLKSIMQ